MTGNQLARFSCSRCGYDLGASPIASGNCPECGEPFSIRQLRARLFTSIRLSLTLIPAGALASIFLGLVVVHLSPHQFATVALVELVPQLCMWWGLAILAAALEPVGRRRLTITATLICSTCSVFSVSCQLNPESFTRETRGWFQLQDLAAYNRLVLPVSRWIALIMSAGIVGRAAAFLSAHGLRRVSNVAAIVGIGGLIVGITSAIQSLFFDANTPRAQATYYLSEAISGDLAVTSDLLSKAVLVSLGLTALTLRSQLCPSEPARQCVPTTETKGTSPSE
jgi:hypothetical protein